jgi:hypothetical protein
VEVDQLGLVAVDPGAALDQLFRNHHQADIVDQRRESDGGAELRGLVTCRCESAHEGRGTFEVPSRLRAVDQRELDQREQVHQFIMQGRFVTGPGQGPVVIDGCRRPGRAEVEQETIALLEQFRDPPFENVTLPGVEQLEVAQGLERLRQAGEGVARLPVGLAFLHHSVAPARRHGISRGPRVRQGSSGNLH